jgi:hypothetical protein
MLLFLASITSDLLTLNFSIPNLKGGVPFDVSKTISSYGREARHILLWMFNTETWDIFIFISVCLVFSNENKILKGTSQVLPSTCHLITVKSYSDLQLTLSSQCSVLQTCHLPLFQFCLIFTSRVIFTRLFFLQISLLSYPNWFIFHK